MRRNRRGFRKESKYKKFLLVLIFCILLPVVAVYGGFYASRYVILPAIMWNEDEVKKETIVEDTQEKKVESKEESTKVEKSPSKSEGTEYAIKGMTIYGIQIGSFANMENAKIQLKELEDKNIMGRIVEKNNFKVIVGFGSKRETIDKIMPIVKEDFKEAFVFEQYIEEKKIIGENSDKEHFVKLNEINKKVFEEMEKIEEYLVESKGTDVELNSSGIEKNIKEIKGLEKELEDINISNKGKEFKEKYTNIMGEFTKSLSNQISSDNVEKSIIGFLDKYSKLHTNN
ncbi:SPOR domain-containing protein [Anaeromicrobium sediminis]|uniref:SPOR domain-containing protein n=1 Tax=Anaeromicrobium sediminis TaxID=1478221 RepID=A0A267MPN7_9FIRM|nr:SPOR domain-containing protein [Anaeromicrobium sediminis]PAB61392.1 hypothetical protein CCE28_02890 [Anaeromicrobium sediminis]